MRDITNDILEAGIRAVEMYAKISGSEQEDGTPERFISSPMATYLPRQTRIQAEVDYEKLADDLRSKLRAKQRRRLQRLLADIVVYEGCVPAAIIEVKKLAYNNPFKSIRNDLKKGHPGKLSSR